MSARFHRGLSPSRLRVIVGVLFVALAVPSAVLIVQTQRQIKWEAFHQYRTLADELGLRIDTELQRLIAVEEARGYADYQFVVIAGDPAKSNFVQRSPLARYPVQSEIPGLVGYFQVGADGAFSTPTLPDDLADPARWGLDPGELAQRVALRESLLDVLRSNALLERRAAATPVPERAIATTDARRKPSTGTSSKRNDVAPIPVTSGEADVPPVVDAVKPDSASDTLRYEGSSDRKGDSATAPSIASQAAFDQLNAVGADTARAQRNELGRVEDLKLERNYQREIDALQKKAPPALQEQRVTNTVAQRTKRKEKTALVDAVEPASRDRVVAAPRVRTFESEVDPFEFSLLGDGHAVLFRKVWRDGRRTIQGAIIAQQPFLHGAIAQPFEESVLAQMSDLVVAYRHDVVQVTPGRFASASASSGGAIQTNVAGELLHQMRLSAPLDEFQLLWNVNRLPAGPGGRAVIGAGAVVLIVLLLAFVVMYRLGLRQIMLARQQQDFVSAVSHELNTPLTSIRMYAEILRDGWAGEEKKREYYSFIHDESERLSRLIANVLQLARMERNELRLELKPTRVAVLVDLLRSKLHSQVERAGFACNYTIDAACEDREVAVDADAFVQIVINLVDNAIKFSAGAATRAVDIGVHAQGDRAVMFSVRDYGPGVEKSQMRRIFMLFYRSGSELTRAALGTGIGLALVRQLARAMRGDADVVNREPGAEFQVTLPSRSAAS